MVKKGGSKRAPNKCPITPRDPLEPQPREGGRGKGKPSQLEDWKSLKPKPPQPRGLVGLWSKVGSEVPIIFKKHKGGEQMTPENKRK